MISISLCMIVKDEEKVLARCIDSVKDAVDEIIIVDTGSHDNTKDIAKNYTDNIFDFKWKEDFSAARNYSFKKASKDYILWLDADDILLEADKKKLIELKETMNDDIDIVMMRYNTGFDEFGNVTMSHFRERLLKTAGNYRWKDQVHEYIELKGNIVTSDICITHLKEKEMTDRNLKIFRKMIFRGEELSPRKLYYYAKELYYNDKYDKAIIYYNRFLDAGKGWNEDNICACYELSMCYKYNKDPENQLRALVTSFKYDAPRPEICCELGYFYKDKDDMNMAIFWFESALRLNKSDRNWGITMYDYWGYIPSIELSVCYYKIGDVQTAIAYNNQAGRYKPDSKVVAYNKEFFSRLGG